MEENIEEHGTMKKNIEEHIKFFEKYMKKTKKERNTIIKVFITSPRTNPSFISIFKLFEFYGGFKKWKENEKNSIIREFVIEFPKTFFLVIGIIINLFLFVLNMIFFRQNALLTGLISVILILLSLALVYRIKQLREEQYNYCYNYLENLFKRGEFFYD